MRCWASLQLAISVSCLVLASAAFATDFRPAVVFDTHQIEAAGFNREALNGALAFQRLHGVKVSLLTPKESTSHDAPLTSLIDQAIKEGANPVVAIGFIFREPIAAAARRYPHVSLVLIDAVVQAPNVQNLVFREEEGAFLMGALAALASSTQAIGFVGGMDIPLIRKFACAYAQGARHVAPAVRVTVAMNGTTVKAFYDTAGTARLAKAQYDQGADVIFHAAGAAGHGVIETAQRQGKLAIGVDFNQNGMAPGHVLTSMLKRMDVAVYLALRETRDGDWRAGTRELGLAENAIGWALDRHNIRLVKEAWHGRLTDLQFDILARKIVVHRYDGTAACPYVDFQ